MASAPATKTPLTATLDVVPQFFSVIFQPDGVTSMSQIQNFTFESTVTQNTVGRIGSDKMTPVNQSKSGTVTFVIYREVDLLEWAIVLGEAAAPGAGQTIELDPALAAQNFLIGNYTGNESASTLVNTDNVIGFKPNSMAGGWNIDGEQIVTITGFAENHFVEVPV